MFIFRCKGINISRSIQIFSQINAVSLHNFIYYVHRKDELMKKIAILASGEGTNAERIIRYFTGHATIEVAVVITSRPTAHVIERAHTLNVPCEVIIPQDFAAGKGLEVLKSYAIDFVVLAGFLVAIPPMIVEAYPSRIINIHPSLIPSFCGVGFYGLHVHEGVLARGVKVTGATVHFVDTGTDTGPIILQKAVEVRQGDTPEVLQRRVMEEAEWKILPKAIDLIANNKVSVQNGKVCIENE